MPFVPHTAADEAEMLKYLGLSSVDELYKEVPSQLLVAQALEEPRKGLSEMEMLQFLQSKANQDADVACFLGAGSYDHFIPSAVWDLTSRGEFMTSYTPYQAEVAQGNLQLIYEFQTMITRLTGMDVANASVYDGATALAEAILMGIRSKRGAVRNILVCGNLNPLYVDAARNIVKQQGITIEEAPFGEGGVVDVSALDALGDACALVIPFPNFFGGFDDVHALTNWARSRDMLTIAVVNPLVLSFMLPPVQWGDEGADIVIGDGQPFGIPMSSGGPSFGFMATKSKYIRQIPGRIVGKTLDGNGKTGFTLTLQAREQHIRRGKATSNICTNQGLLVTAGTIYMTLMGAAGLKKVALSSHKNTKDTLDRLLAITGVEKVFSETFFHEAVIRVRDARGLLAYLEKHRVLGGLALEDSFSQPQLKNTVLFCVTEKRTSEEMDLLVNLVKQFQENVEV